MGETKKKAARNVSSALSLYTNQAVIYFFLYKVLDITTNCTAIKFYFTL